MNTDLAEIDLTDPSWFAEGPPHELFARMRAEAPVRWNPSADGPGFWSLTRAADLAAVSKDAHTFSSHRGGIWLREDTLAPLDLARNLMIFKDPPEHTRYRVILRSAFTPLTVAKLESAVRAQVVALLDAAVERGGMDAVEDLAVPVPLMVIASLLGVPDSDIPKLRDWTARLDAGVADPANTEGPAALGEMAAYLAALVPEQAEDADSLVAALHRAEVDGQRLTETEIVLFFGILVFAGNDTTRNATSGGLLALAEHPEQFAALTGERIPNAVEEILRWTTPLNYFARTATEDTEVGGRRIRAGERLVMWYASANRDSDAFPDPMRFDVTREPTTQHAAFGAGGRHFCLGAALARLELRVIFEEVVRRMGPPGLAGPVRRASSIWVNGLASLPLSCPPK
ncbi:cytochrome P450 [Pseudonocardia eucalypti]|uniref:Cytochrome P450 n=1 Tax=Pseudonocardia eucalypti TaxID=648755 RepID=A0ABP9Q4X0_9PSEU|nr:cytochrome P450 [Pseudonocardia eucalypti]